MRTCRRGSRLLRSALFLIAALCVVPPDATAQEPRILLVGDSWTHYIWKDRILRNALVVSGLGFADTRGDRTAIGGTTASNWITPQGLALIDAELAAYPTIDIVHLSLGGNDVLGGYHTSLTPADRAALWSTIRAQIQAIVDHVLSGRPGMRVLIVGYDYLNLHDTVMNGNRTAQAMWLMKGQPSPTQINEAFVELAYEKQAVAQATAYCEYLADFGLMQAIYGYPPVYAPGQLPAPGVAPGYTPFPGGDPAWPSPPVALDLVSGGHRDPIHLNAVGYGHIVQRCIDTYYRSWLTAAAPPTPPTTGGGSSGGGASGGATAGVGAGSGSNASPATSSGGGGGCTVTSTAPGLPFPFVVLLVSVLAVGFRGPRAQRSRRGGCRLRAWWR